MVFRVLDRYVYREMMPIFLFTVILFTFLDVTDRLQVFTNMAVSGAPLGVVLGLWGLLLLSFLSHTIPMGLLLAVVMATGRLASDREIVALSALGVSPLRLFRPFLFASLVAALMIAVLTVWINPWGSAAFYRGVKGLREYAAIPLVQERTFTRIGNLVVYADQMDPSTSELHGILVADEREPTALTITAAPHGRLIGDAQYGRAILRLTDGTIHESHPGSPEWYRVTKFNVFETPLDLAAQIDEAEKEAGPQRNLATWDLIANTRALDFSLGGGDMFVVEFHKRLAFPLAPIVFAMVAFPLGIGLHRGGRAVAAVGGIVIYLAHHSAQEGLGHVLMLRSWGGQYWIPIIAFALVGGVLLYYTAKPAPRTWRRSTDLLELLRFRLPLPRRSTAGARRQPTRRRGHVNSIVDRYLARQFLVYFGFGLAVATAIFIIVDLTETLSRYKPPLDAVFKHFAYRLPAALHQSLPIVVLVATIFLFMELQRHHELTALKAAGLSLHRVSVPVLALAGMMSVGAFVFQETVAPALNAKGEEVDRVEIRKTMAPGSKPNLFWYRRSGSEFVRLGRLDRARREVSDVTLIQTDPNFRLIKRFDAAQAAWAPNGLQFGRTVLREFGPGNSVRTEWPSGTPVHLADSLEALGAMPAPSAMTFMELRAYVHHLRERGQAVGTQMLYLHAKLSFPLMSLVLAVLAISCATRWPGGGRLIGGAIAVAIAIGYWVVNSGALSLGRVDLLPPIVAAWAANIVFGGVGVSLLLRTPT